MNDKLDALDRLAKLKADGAITEAEFSEGKRKILQAGPSAPPTSELITDKNLIPWYRRPLYGLLWGIVCAPIALLVMWTGPSYVKVKGGYTKMGTGTKTFCSIILVIYLLWALAETIGDISKGSPSPSSQYAAPSADTPSPSANNGASPPNMRVESEPSPTTVGILIRVTGDDDQPFTVQRVVVNGRAGEPGCDSTLKDEYIDPYVPAQLKRGDTTAAQMVCGTVLTADVYTDRGKNSFKFN